MIRCAARAGISKPAGGVGTGDVARIITQRIQWSPAWYELLGIIADDAANGPSWACRSWGPRKTCRR